MNTKSCAIPFLVLLASCSAMSLYQPPTSGPTASLSVKSDIKGEFLPVSFSTWDCSKYADDTSDVIGHDLREGEVITVKIAAKKPFPFITSGSLPAKTYTCAVRAYFVPEEGVDYQLVYHHAYGKCSVQISQVNGPFMEILQPDTRTGMCN